MFFLMEFQPFLRFYSCIDLQAVKTISRFQPFLRFYIGDKEFVRVA
jgi:hypothetical protein